MDRAPYLPKSAEELAAFIKEAGSDLRSLSIGGNNSKQLMAGPRVAADLSLSTARLDGVLQYEPHDLTVSVEAGMPWAALQAMLARNGQMIALDPPFAASATVGGVIASNASGAMRKHFGTARDLVIGMQFAMLDGKLVRTGGMVVKNVAGLDIGKLLIGSFGTLAVITSVNFRLHSLPEETHTFLFSFADMADAMRKRDVVLRSVLRPVSIDYFTPTAAARLGHRGSILAIRAAGTKRVLERYARELIGSEHLTGSADERLWAQVREFPADWLRENPAGLVLRVSTAISDVEKLLQLIRGAGVSRAASGVTYAYLNSWTEVDPLWRAAGENGWAAAVEYAPDEIRQEHCLWLAPKDQNEAGFAMMKSVKQIFDPRNLLNRSRLYGRI